jgi:uncharacterized protein (DUF58 family)
MTAPADILYRPRGRFRSNLVGAHASSEVGGFGVFRDQTSFLRHPDARRIDVRATLRDPFGSTYVRRFEQRSSIELYVVMDLSASMGFVGSVDRFEVAFSLCESLALSATRIGDRFGIIGAGGMAKRPLFFGATRARSAALAAIARLRRHGPCGAGADGLCEAARLLGTTRKLVALISDFRWPDAQIGDVLDSFALHDVAPLVLVDSLETQPPRWGLLELVDSETRDRRLLFMRPSLRSRWIEAEQARRRRIAQLAATRSRAPIFIEDRFDATTLSQQLMAA